MHVSFCRNIAIVYIHVKKKDMGKKINDDQLLGKTFVKLCRFHRFYCIFILFFAILDALLLLPMKYITFV